MSGLAFTEHLISSFRSACTSSTLALQIVCNAWLPLTSISDRITRTRISSSHKHCSLKHSLDPPCYVSIEPAVHSTRSFSIKAEKRMRSELKLGSRWSNIPGRASVLVVEDEDISRESLADMLEQLGFDVMQACDGVQAVTLALRHTPDVVFMDIAMPVMNGIDAASAIKETMDVPIIAFSGTRRSDPEWMRLFANVLQKPAGIASVTKVLTEVMPQRN